jgi:hypothetical protein
MITRALVQEHGMGRLEPEMRSAHDELVRRGIPVSLFLHKHLVRGRVALDRHTLVVGEIPDVELALHRLGIEPPGEPGYPDALSPFLLRKVWPSTMREVRDALADARHGRFVKPRDRLKRFTGRVVDTVDDLARLHAVSASAPVWCAEVVRFVSEHRVFVIDGAVVGTRCYGGDPSLQPALRVVDETIGAWTRTGAATAAYGIDFGVLDDGRTALVELNDGYSLGSYGLEDSAYLDLLVRRWQELTTT